MQMLKKGNKLYSILTGRCPRCHAQSMYKNPNPYLLNRIFAMHEKCSLCGLKYKMEPSFFYGAMYVSYGLGVAFGTATFVISFVFLGSTLNQAFVSIALVLLVLVPLIMRLSRNIWINFFVHYDPKAIEEYLSS